MKVARIYTTIIDLLLCYLKNEEETLIRKQCDSSLLGYYKITREYIEDRMAEELSLLYWKLDFDLKKKSEDERGFPKQVYDTILPLIKKAKEDGINFCEME